ncbi:MAG TPA: YfhO family protein [Chitinophagaceae bacterium]|nr:YfhO family protein [Chitinophagaceae bacterium]
MKFSFSRNTKDYLFLLLVAVIAYWPVSFMLLSLKNDAINYFLAMRYNVSEAIQYNYFPSWSPYINMGYPMHADMQSGVWNPLVIIMSIIRKYDIYWLHVETMITIFLSGLSMYHLLKHFRLNRKVILMVSCAYMLNGFITDAGQFLNWLYAAAILPFVILSVIRCFSDYKLKNAFLLGLSHSLMLLCSYPADFILLSYILLFFVIFSFGREAKKNSFRFAFSKTGQQVLVASLSFIAICLPAIVSYIPFINSISRGSGVDVETALTNSLAPASLISFITPWATQKGEIFQATDPLIRNCYIGIILFIFLISYFIQKRSRSFIEKFFIGVFIFFLLFSLGRTGGLRLLSYKLLPLMDTFRHPANAKLFFIFSGQVFAAFALESYFKDEGPTNKLIRKISLSLLIVCSIFLIVSFSNSTILLLVRSGLSEPGFSLANNIKSIKDSLSFYDLLFLNLLLVISILLIFYFFHQKNKLRKYILWISVIEMALVAQGMLPLTYVRKSPPSQVQNILNKQPQGYPLPDSKISIEKYSENGMKYFDIIGCLNPYNKKPGRSDYVISPANLRTQENYWDNYLLRNKINKYPFAYFADTIYSIKDSILFQNSKSAKRGCLIEKYLNIQISDSNKINNGVIKFIKFVPGKIIIETTSSTNEFLVILQNKYPNWKAYINGTKQPILLANLSFMGIIIHRGKNIIEFRYEIGYLKYLIIISLIYTIAGLILILYFGRIKQK